MPLHDLISGLDGAQDVYARGRPPYPPALVDALTQDAGVVPGARVLDLGAGTGLLSGPLLEAGYDVIAVEPLAGMRESLSAAIGPERVLDGTAESIPLPDASLDAVLCGDSYHWFDPDGAPRELHRVLRPGGVVGLTWRWVDVERAAPWVEGFAELLDDVRPEHPGFTTDRGTDGLARHGGFEPVRRERKAFDYETTVDGIRAYVASITYVAVLEAERRERLLDAVADLLSREPEPFAVPMFADVWLTTRLA